MSFFIKVLGVLSSYAGWCIVLSCFGWLLIRFTPFKKAGLFLVAAFCFSGKHVSRVCHKYKVFRCSSCGRDDCRNWSCQDYYNPIS